MTLIHPTLTSLLETVPLSTFLLDASGVIYNDSGPIPDIAKTVQKLQQIGTVVLVTNNTYLYIDEIQTKLADMDIHLPTSHIISSGLGLQHTPQIRELIEHKTVYVYGREKTHAYIQNANPSTITTSVQDAEAVVLMGTFLPDAQDTQFPVLIEALKNRPDIPIICANPDQVIRGKTGTKKVIGYLAKYLEHTLKRPVHWVGKPYTNFSGVIQTLTQKLNIPLSASVGFFDDNPENVQQLQHDLNITGITVVETGISYTLTPQELQNNRQTDHYLSRLQFG